MIMENEDPRYVSIKELAKDPKCPFSYSELRHLLFDRHKNGLEVTTKKVGTKLYIRTELFYKWLASRTQGVIE
jgi:hypothetical protein